MTWKLEEGIRQLSKAKLKPQQRLFFLRVHLLPSLYHELVLGQYSKGLLRYLDRCSRQAVRRWLHLPHDVPQPFFHAQAPDGGLRIPELLVLVPVMRRARVEKLFDRATWLRDPVMVAAIGKSKVTPPAAKALGRWSAMLQSKGDESNRPEAVHCDRERRSQQQLGAHSHTRRAA